MHSPFDADIQSTSLINANCRSQSQEPREKKPVQDTEDRESIHRKFHRGEHYRREVERQQALKRKEREGRTKVLSRAAEPAIPPALTASNLNLLQDSFIEGSPENADLGDMSRTYIEGMGTEAEVEQHIMYEQARKAEQSRMRR